ncbi:hypothetical protein [Nostoc sp. KVJ20]|nr:hypothetical protein [Nostoc sp. KVJ20]
MAISSHLQMTLAMRQGFTIPGGRAGGRAVSHELDTKAKVY